MSDKATDWLTGPGGQKAIPVAVVEFARPIDFPGKAMTVKLVDSEQKNTARHRIYFLPWMRVIAVLAYKPNEETPTAPPRFVHESLCAWDPKV